MNTLYIKQHISLNASTPPTERNSKNQHVHHCQQQHNPPPSSILERTNFYCKCGFYVGHTVTMTSRLNTSPVSVSIPEHNPHIYHSFHPHYGRIT